MLQQTAQPRMMKLPRRRRLAIRLGNCCISEQRLEQPFQIRIRQARDSRLKLIPQLSHIASGRRQHVHLVGFARQRLAKLIDLHLRAVVIARHAAAHLDHVSAIEVFCDARIAQLPHATLDLPVLVAEHQAQIWFVLLGGSLLLGQHEEEAVEAPCPRQSPLDRQYKCLSFCRED